MDSPFRTGVKRNRVAVTANRKISGVIIRLEKKFDIIGKIAKIAKIGKIKFKLNFFEIFFFLNSDVSNDEISIRRPVKEGRGSGAGVVGKILFLSKSD